MLSDAGQSIMRFFTRGKRMLARRRADWSEVADARGGRFEVGHARLFSWKSPELEVPVGDVAVLVDLLLQRAGNVTVVFTRFRASYLLAVGPKFRVAPSRTGQRIASALGFEDVAMGDDAWDERFTVRSSDAESVRQAWTPKARKLLTDLHDKHLSLVQSEGQSATLLYTHPFAPRPIVERGIELVAELARYGHSYLDALRSIEGAEWLAPTGPWNERTTPGVKVTIRTHPVHIHPAMVELGVRATASAKMTRDIERFAFDTGSDGAVHGQVVEGLLGPSAGTVLARLGVAHVDHDGQRVRISPEGVPDPKRLRAAAELAAHLALGEVREGGFR